MPYVIPTSISSPVTNPNMNDSFLLLNSEMQNQTNLFGFEFYANSSGTINIKV